jgi:hypothetical protein
MKRSKPMTATIRPRTLTSIAFLVLLLVSTFAFVAAARPADAARFPIDSDNVPATVMTADEALARVISPDGVLRFDVAEDMSRFAFSASPVHEDGMPAHGNAFITQGYIYPYGTLSEGNGVNPDGTPEFPELVLGEWTCRGWFVGEGAHATSGAWVITTQLYVFGDGQLDAAVLVSDGYELADVGVPGPRAITGGTGPFAAASGDGQQTFLGFNASEGVNLRFELAVADLEQPIAVAAPWEFPPYS